MTAIRRVNNSSTEDLTTWAYPGICKFKSKQTKQKRMDLLKWTSVYRSFQDK